YSLAIHGAPLESIAAELGVSVAVAENLLDEAWEVVKSQARAQREPVGTTEATAVAVRSVARGLRLLGFRGRAPTMARDVADGGVQLVNIQRANSGITGREPGFTLNL